MLRKSIDILPYAPDRAEAWDRIVRESRNGTFLHLRGFIGYHAHRFEECSVLVTLDGAPAFVLPCTRHGEDVVSHGGLTFGGLIHGMELRAELCREVFAALRRWYRDRGARRLVYKAAPWIYHRYPAEEDLYALHQEGGRLIRRDLSSVILMPNRPRYAEGRREGLRRAAARGLTVAEGVFFGPFHDLLSAVLARHGAVPVHAPEEMALLQSRFPENLRLFGAFEGPALRAAAWVFDHGHLAHLQYMAVSPEGRRMGALDHLVDALIAGPFAERRLFSLGTSNGEGGRRLNPGLVHQKQGFGARGVVHDHYEIPL